MFDPSIYVLEQSPGWTPNHNREVRNCGAIRGVKQLGAWLGTSFAGPVSGLISGGSPAKPPTVCLSQIGSA